MKRIYPILLAGLSAIPLCTLHAQNTATMQNCEYWFDYDFASRTSETMNSGNLEKTFDVSALTEGVHSIGLRFGDRQGRWAAPIIKHFVIPALPPQNSDDNKATTLQYWFDYNYAERQSVNLTNGNAVMALDLSALSTGVHSIGYTVSDKRGYCTYPVVKHFVIPGENLPAITGITAYEYWFNKGKRVRVDVDPQNPLQITDLAIEIKDVVPNALTQAYRFVPDEGMVYQPDHIVFGIQAFDNLNHPSSAVMSETFAFDVPVNPNFHTLQDDESYDFPAPTINAMQGFKATTVANDSVIFWLSPGGGTFDLYDENGQTIATETTVTEYGLKYVAIAPNTTVYALLWDVPVSLCEMQISYEHHSAATGLAQLTTGDKGWKIRSDKGTLTVETSQEVHLAITSTQGVSVVNQWYSSGIYTYPLPKGIYFIRFNNGPAVKTVVR